MNRNLHRCLSWMAGDALLMNQSHSVAVYFKAAETNALVRLFVVGIDQIDTIRQTTDGQSRGFCGARQWPKLVADGVALQ